jgi:hypothetical protein
MTTTFDPRSHLISIKTKQGDQPYLQVAWRLAWFRLDCPDGTISTELVHFDPDRETVEEAFVWNDQTKRKERVLKTALGFCVFKATITTGKGASATAYKSEKAASFPDFMEKCETGAIGRALAMLGYGTQFTGDELSEREFPPQESNGRR